jgi:hypothetical protein
MTLYEATRHLHHACEQHPVGQRMVNATISDQEWCDWIGALRTLHIRLDAALPPYAHVTGHLNLDLVELLPLGPHISRAAHAFAMTHLSHPVACMGAAYVLIGAHRRGGRVTEKKFRDAGRTLPCHHVRFFAADAAENLVKSLRDKVQLTPYATATFATLLAVMDEIEARHVAGPANGDVS